MKKRKIILSLGVLMLPLSIVAQGQNFTSSVKGIVNEYMIPILLIGMVVAAGVGLLFNIEDFADRKGEGTRSKALINIGWIVGIAFVSILALIAIINYVFSNNVQIN